MKKSGKLKKVLSVSAALLFTASFVTGCNKSNSQASKQELHIYSIIHEEETEALTKLFTEKTGIPASFLRASTGELVNRVINEKDNPQADILLGGATSYHMQAAKEGALESYSSEVAKELPDFAKAPDGTWTAFCYLTLGIGVNKTRFAEKFPEITIPRTWDDLLNPAFNGEIVLTNPVASSTAYLFVQNQLQRLGEEAGWDYLLNLSKLVGQFPDSGSAPAKLLGTAEYAIAVSYLHSLAKYASDGFDVLAIAPPQTVAEVDCISIMKNSKNLEGAKAFVDFMLSKEAQELMSSMDFTVPVNPKAKGAEGSISVQELDLINYDKEKASKEKTSVLEKWTQNVK